MKEIKLTRGRVALVDDDDFESLSEFKWHFQIGQNRKTGYAVRMCYKSGKRKSIRMHRQVLNFPKCAQIDHINGDGLDNRKENLRICSNSQNQKNGPRRSDNTSGYKGVSWHKQKKKWIARIVVNGKRIEIGAFDDKLSAAKAYDAAARFYYDEFARPNFP